jgi:HSP20 family protein
MDVLNAKTSTLRCSGVLRLHQPQPLDKGAEKESREWRSKNRKKGGISMKGLVRWDPFRIMRRWDPFSEMREMQRDMDRLFDRFLGRDISIPETRIGELMPLVESYMKGNDLVFKCELPGVDPKEVDVSFDENTHQLIIKGERKQEKGTKDEDYIYRELAYGAFERRFTLPEGVKTDQLKAKFTNGILEITVPAPAISRPKKIEIETPKLIEGEAAVKKAA